MGVTILLSGLCAQGLCRDKDFRGCNNFMKKSNKRLNIGFFTCHLDNDYAYEVCKGVDYAAKELDVNLIVFPGMYMNASYNDPKNARFDYQYNSIFYYASKHTLDALIVSIGSIGSFLSENDMIAFLKNLAYTAARTLEREGSFLRASLFGSGGTLSGDRGAGRRHGTEL